MKASKPSKKSASPARLVPLRVAVLGCGAWGRQHVRNLLTLPGVDVLALVDDNHAAAARLRDEELVPKGKPCSLFHTLDEQLRLAPVDAVVIATPHHLHYPQTRTALKAGVHVLVEKPMATSTRHATELIELSRRVRRVLAIAFQGACTSELAYVRQLVERGALGEISTIDAFLSQPWVEACRGTWRLRRSESGGGILHDAASHLLHAILWLTELKPVEVFAVVDCRGQEVDVVSTILIRFDNGALATLLIDGDARPFGESIRIMGSRGTVVTTPRGGELQHYEGSRLLKYPPVANLNMTVESNFVDAVRGRAEVVSPARWGLAFCRLMDAIYASARTRRPVKVKES